MAFCCWYNDLFNFFKVVDLSTCVIGHMLSCEDANSYSGKPCGLIQFIITFDCSVIVNEGRYSKLKLFSSTGLLLNGLCV